MFRYSANNVACKAAFFLPLYRNKSIRLFSIPIPLQQPAEVCSLYFMEIQNAFANRPLVSYSNISDLIHYVSIEQFCGLVNCVFSFYCFDFFQATKLSELIFIGDCRQSNAYLIVQFFQQFNLTTNLDLLENILYMLFYGSIRNK
jgi:hypothetical protein